MPGLDSFDNQISTAPTEQAPTSAWHELSSAFVQESKMQLKGLAQTVGAGDLITVTPYSNQPDGLMAQHAQMFGHAAADAIPIIVTGVLVRAGFGAVLAKSSEPGLLLQRSVLGLSTAETATTGFVTGSLLHTSDAQNTSTLGAFVLDRTKSGVSSALSFASINAFSHIINSSVSTSESTVARILKNPAASGMLSGIPAGLISPQIDSEVRNGHFNTDFSATGKSIYESALIGAAFGGLASFKSPRAPNESVENKSPNIETPPELEYIALPTPTDLTTPVVKAGDVGNIQVETPPIPAAVEKHSYADNVDAKKPGAETESELSLSTDYLSLGLLLQKLKQEPQQPAEVTNIKDAGNNSSTDIAAVMGPPRLG